MKFNPKKFEYRELGSYYVTACGRVFNKYHGMEMKRYFCKNSYVYVFLHKVNKRHSRTVHSLVMEAFVGKPPRNKEINHKDGNKHNCNLSNLEYVTHKQNTRHAKVNGLLNPRKKFSDEQVLAFLKDVALKHKYQKYNQSYATIAFRHGISRKTAWLIIRGKIRKDLTVKNGKSRCALPA